MGLNDLNLDDLYKQESSAFTQNNNNNSNSNNSNSNNSNSGAGLTGSISNMNQSLNQGMNVAGEKAEEIEIYMGDQAKDMVEGVGKTMDAMGNAMQNAGNALQEKGEELKKGTTDEKKDESK